MHLESCAGLLLANICKSRVDDFDSSIAAACVHDVSAHNSINARGIGLSSFDRIIVFRDAFPVEALRWGGLGMTPWLRWG
jgi:hypothetical protein